MADEYVTVREVAWKLRVSKMTVYRLLRRDPRRTDPLPSIQVGRSFRIPRKEFDEWLERRRSE